MEAAITASALLCTTAISLAPNLILFCFPNYGSNSDKANKNTSTVLSLGQALAAGGLLGDVFLHTLPHLVEEGCTGHDHHKGVEEVGMGILIGFSTFLCLDVIVRTFGGHSHDHSHDHPHDNGTANGHAPKAQTNTNTNTNTNNSNSILLSPAILLNLAADSLHNFTDGLAIGASFAASAPTLHYDTTQTLPSNVLSILSQSRGGLVASFSILLHEIPHELGDFAILLKAGMTRRRAILAQFGTAVAALCGTLVGVWGVGVNVHVDGGVDGDGYARLVPFTAGGFVYLAAVHLLPDLLEDGGGGGRRVLQLVAFAVGVGIMYTVAELEHGDHHHHHHHDHHHHHHHGDHHHHHHDHHHHEL